METLPTTYQENIERFDAENTLKQAPFGGRRHTPTAEDWAKAATARKEKAASWEFLPTRQNFVDEVFMRGIISDAGLRVGNSSEPASVSRLRSLLRRAGVSGEDAAEAVGVSVKGFLELNTNLPLWAALSMILESTGKFDGRLS